MFFHTVPITPLSLSIFFSFQGLFLELFPIPYPPLSLLFLSGSVETRCNSLALCFTQESTSTIDIHNVGSH